MSSHHIDLLIGKLQEIHIFQNGKHFPGTRFLVIIPHQVAVIDVKAYQLAQLMGSCHSILCSLHGFSCRQGAGACLNDPAGLKILIFNLALVQHHISARLSGKGKTSVIVLIQRHKSHSCNRFFRHLRSQRRHVILPQGLQKKSSEIVVSHLAVDTGFQAVSRGSNRHVRRRSACVSDIACFFLSRYKVNHHLANCYKIHSPSCNPPAF